MPDPEIVPGPVNPTDSIAVAALPPEAPAPEAAPVSEKPTMVPYEDFARVTHEAAERRVALKQQEAIWDGLDGDTRESINRLIELAKDGSPEAINTVAEIFGLEVPNQQPEYISQSDLQKALDERDQRLAEQQSIESVYREAEGLGYKRGSREMVDVLWHLNNSMEEPDVRKAHDLVQAERQAIIDEYVTGQQERARNTPILAEMNGAAPNTTQPPRTANEARAAALARFANQQR